MSDGEFLMQSAFGYRWLKSIPQTKVDELRKRFLELMTTGEDAQEQETLEARQKSLKEAEVAAKRGQLQEEMHALPHVSVMEAIAASESYSTFAATATANASDGDREAEEKEMGSLYNVNSDSPRRATRTRRERDLRKSQIMLRYALILIFVDV